MQRPRSWRGKLMAEGIECLALFPKGMDANGYAMKVAPAQKSLGLALRQLRGWAVALQHRSESSKSLRRWLRRFRNVLNSRQSSRRLTRQSPSRKNRSTLPLAAEEPVEIEAASPVPPPSTPPDVPTENKAEEVVITLGERRYRMRGFDKNSPSTCCASTCSLRAPTAFTWTRFDLYSAKQRASFIKQAAQDLGLEDETIKKDLGKVLLKLEALQEQQIHKTLEPKVKTPTLSDAEQDAALELLRDPRLSNASSPISNAAGVVGEEVNKLMGYMAAVSRKLEAPLA